MNPLVSTTEKQTLFHELAHLIKNKQQALSGGSYLLELGIKNNKPELIKKGWEIVQHNNAELNRCSSCLLLLLGNSSKSDYISLSSLISNAIEDFYSGLNHDSIQHEFVQEIPDINLQADYSLLRIVILKILGLCATASVNSLAVRIKIAALTENDQLKLVFTPLQPVNLLRLNDTNCQDCEDISRLEWGAIRRTILGMNGNVNIEQFPQHENFSVVISINISTGNPTEKSNPANNPQSSRGGNDADSPQPLLAIKP
jgi:hypothetical protein